MLCVVVVSKEAAFRVTQMQKVSCVHTNLEENCNAHPKLEGSSTTFICTSFPAKIIKLKLDLQPGKLQHRATWMTIYAELPLVAVAF